MAALAAPWRALSRTIRGVAVDEHQRVTDAVSLTAKVGAR